MYTCSVLYILKVDCKKISLGDNTVKWKVNL